MMWLLHWLPLPVLARVGEHFQAYARSMLESGILWWASKRRLRRLIVLAPGLIDHPSEAGYLLCPHFVRLDVASIAIVLNTSLCSIYSQQNNAVFDGALRKGRSRFHPVSISPRSQGIKHVIRAMRDGRPFFMCPDMDFGAKDAVFVHFLASRPPP